MHIITIKYLNHDLLVLSTGISKYAVSVVVGSNLLEYYRLDLIIDSKYIVL